MRTVNDSEDRGAVLVLVGILMTALLGIGAMVVDLGALYVEKRQLQNGADAAALAVAQDCANGNCVLTPGLAQQYADSNAKDGTSSVSLCGVGPGLTACTAPAPVGATGATGWLRASTVTRTAGGGNEVNFVLGPVMDSLAGATVHAAATAAWGPLGSGDVLPITFSVCEWSAMGGSIANGTFPAGATYIYLHGAGGKKETGVGHCTASPSGQDLPGGFGFLDSTSCVTTVAATAWVAVEPGNSLPKGCNPNAWLNTEVLIAMYDVERGSGRNGEYHVAGFVGFRITGYQFQGNKRGPGNFDCPLAKGNSVTCLLGTFTRYTTDAHAFGGSDFGARVVKMVG
jgi:Flp pilus assembly protein TadG